VQSAGVYGEQIEALNLSIRGQDQRAVMFFIWQLDLYIKLEQPGE
jgi:hypothetical protein